MTKKPDPSTNGWTRLKGVFDRFRASLSERSSKRSESADSTATTHPETDREIVFYVLRERGGRVKQSTLVTRTGWSASKVSRLLTAMEDRGIIERVRVGREKVVVDTERDER